MWLDGGGVVWGLAGPLFLPLCLSSSLTATLALTLFLTLTLGIVLPPMPNAQYPMTRPMGWDAKGCDGTTDDRQQCKYEEA